MKYITTINKILLGWLALAAAHVIAGMFVPIKMTSPPHALAWMLLSDLVIAATLGAVAMRSDWTGWKLAFALVAVPFAINLVDMIEGTVFLKHSGIPWLALMLMVSLNYVFVLPAWRYIFGQGENAPAHGSPLQRKSAGSMVWRFAVSDLAYVFLYFAAGMVILPYVRDFYATQAVPPPGTIAALQLLVRGPVFVALCLLLVRMIGLSRLTGALMVGLAFTLLSGVAPLLMPNPFFPDAVRWVHFAEVTSSNFVFGAIVGLLWGPRKSAAESGELRRAA